MMGYVFEAMQRAQTAPQIDVTAGRADDAIQPIMLDPRRLRLIDERLVVWTDATTLAAEEYRAIRTGLLARWQHRRHLTHTITSAVPQEGKTLTSLNLAASLGELKDRTCVVVEADLRRPVFAKMMQLPDGPGLSEVLRGKASLEQVIHPIGGRNVWLLAAGSQADAASVQLLSGSGMADVLAQLKRRFDHVVIDTPPVNAAADAAVLGALCDEVILVARMGSTPVPLIEQATRTLAQAQAKVAGVIATGSEARQRAYGYSYDYGRDTAALRRAA